MLGDEGLQLFLLREAFFFERFKLSLLIQGIDALCHRIQRSRSGRALDEARAEGVALPPFKVDCVNAERFLCGAAAPRRRGEAHGSPPRR